MNRNCYRLVFNSRLGMRVPQAETARSRSKAPGGTTLGAVAGSLVISLAAQAAPLASTGAGMPAFVTYGQASLQQAGNKSVISQVGNKSILNWKSFNVGAGETVQFQQVTGTGSNTLVPGASFTSLNRIWDTNPSVIAGAITQGAGQQANVILVNNNGIAFMGGAQVNLNSFTATSLNLADKYITNGLLGDLLNPQFVADDASKGFVKVFEGAQITAGTQGRVMLIAPTVVNRGTVAAPEGQVILAAGTKAYLRANDDSSLNLRGLLIEVDNPAVSNFTTPNSSVPAALANVADDLSGHATNIGTVSTPRGNITMVGYAVNQKGMASATTSVVSNGSIYLMAKDTQTINGSAVGSLRAGQVVIGADSKTTIAIETADKTASIDNADLGKTGLDKPSEVNVLGSRIYMASGAKIVAPAGKVSFTALDDPSSAGSPLNPTLRPSDQTSSAARVHIASGATVDVAGLDAVEVSVARNTVEVELRGDELKDSPVNRNGPLRGKKVYLDIEKALANAAAGKSTLIANDSLLAYQNKLERTAAERATTGGSVTIRSQGQSIIESGASFDLSGGSVKYTSANVQRTLLSGNGKLVDLVDATADTYYKGVSNQLTVNYARWNRSDVFKSGPNSTRFEAGYIDGKSAGTLAVESMGSAVFQGNVRGKTTPGEQQINGAKLPSGATLRIGTADIGTASDKDYKINQSVDVRNGYSAVLANLTQDAALPTSQQQLLEIDGSVLGKDKVANLNVFTNKSLTTSTALNAPQKGSVVLTGNQVVIGANIDAAGGVVSVAATVNQSEAAQTERNLQVADGVALTAKGAWVDNKAGVAVINGASPYLDGGAVSLSALNGTVALGAGVLADASAGASRDVAGKVKVGKGGTISVAGFGVEGLAGAQLNAYAFEQGGALNLISNQIQIGGTVDPATKILGLDPLFFTKGGFEKYNLTGLASVEVAANTGVSPTQKNYVLRPASLTSPGQVGVEDQIDIAQRPSYQRRATSFQVGKQGDLVTPVVLVDQGAKITVEQTGSIGLQASDVVDVRGALSAKAGSIALQLDAQGVTPNVNAIWLGTDASLDASGTSTTYLDNQGRTQGVVRNAGTVSLNAKTGYVMAEAGSQIRVNGGSPVLLAERNAQGTVGRVAASDAGSIQVFAQEGIVLESSIQAYAGSETQRGGTLSVTLAKNARAENQVGYDSDARELHIAATVAPQTTNLSHTTLVPITGDTRATIGWDKLQNSGLDSIGFSSRDAIVLEGGLNASSGRAMPLRELTLDAARIETKGGDVSLVADTLRMGNYDTSNRVGADPAAVSGGTLTAQSRSLDLAGKLRLRGMEQAKLIVSESVQLSGVTVSKLNADGTNTGTFENAANIRSSADLTLSSRAVTPSSYSTATIDAPGKTVSFVATGEQPQQPLSAMGTLNVSAQNINQNGRLMAPLGQINLTATENLALGDNSLTSVAADAGSVLPLGQTVNGKSWIVNVRPDQVPAGQLAVDQPVTKTVQLKGSSVKLGTGAQVNVAGGGDAQAYEFTVGPGGSRDILNDANIYAILPDFKGAVAPTEPQGGFSLASGTSVYLSGVAGLANGTYTLLPSHYALLPGAYAVRLDTKGVVFPGQEYTRQDGVRVASGYLTDSRMGAPRDANWKGFEVLSNAQVRARSEIGITKASEFFSTAASRPADAGQISISATGAGAANLQLSGKFLTTAGAGGRGASVDISAPNIALVSSVAAGSAGWDPATTALLGVDQLNALGAQSLLIGATRTAGNSATDLAVGASTVTLANSGSSALKAAEIMLAATDTVALRDGSALTAQAAGTEASTAPTGSTSYTTTGAGAFVRAATADASFTRSNVATPISTGTLSGGTSTTITAARAITLDATLDNSFKGKLIFNDGKQATAGSLANGAQRINLGAAPAAASGIVYSQSDLDGLNSLDSLTLTSYNTIDFYGTVNVGGSDVAGKPTLNTLTLNGAGLAGLGSAVDTATVRAKTVTLANPGAAPFVAGGTLGSGQLAVSAQTLNLAAGAKRLDGFSGVDIAATELIGQSLGSTVSASPVVARTGLISGEKGAQQSLTSSGQLSVQRLAGVDSPTEGKALGASWTLEGSSVALDSVVRTPTGSVKLNATSGDVQLGSNAVVDAAGRTVAFFDQTSASSAGRVSISSTGGNVVIADKAQVDVSAVAGGDAGSLGISAVNGTADIAAGALRGTGANLSVDVGSLASFSSINDAANLGGFAGQRNLRVRNGDVTVAATDVVTAKTITVSADKGKLDIYGTIDASAAADATIGLYARDNVTLLSGAALSASSSQAGKTGGQIEIGSTSGEVALRSGSAVNLSGAAGGQGGTMNLRALRTGAGAGTGVKVTDVSATVSGARQVTVEAVKVYNGVTTLNATGASSGVTLSLATISTENTSFGNNVPGILASLNKTTDSSFKVRAGVEVRSTGNLTFGTAAASTDWNLGALPSSAGPATLTLRAANGLNMTRSISDGFTNAVAAIGNGALGSTASNTPLTTDSWSYRMVAGADTIAANPMTTVATNPAVAQDFTLANDKFIRTGTGSIQIAAARDIKMGNSGSVIYTAGKASAALADFTAPVNSQRAYFTQGGGNLSMSAGRDVLGVASTQLYSDWLFRQGRLSADGTFDVTTPGGSPAWWVRFDLFKQGVGALGGGNVAIAAGGKVSNLSASAATQGRVTSSATATSLVKTGGGNVRVESQGDLLGGQYYADNGDVTLRAGGVIGSGQSVSSKPVYTTLALGDGRANVKALGDVNIQGVVNPTLLPQLRNSTGAVSIDLANLSSASNALLRRSYFSTYSDASELNLTSTNGNVLLHSVRGSDTVGDMARLYPATDTQRSTQEATLASALQGLGYLPGNVNVTATQGSVVIGKEASGQSFTMQPVAKGSLKIFAKDSVSLNASLTMSDQDPALLANASRPASSAQAFYALPTHAANAVHQGDTVPALVYAVNGDVTGVSAQSAKATRLISPKALQVRAGNDIKSLTVGIQNVDGAGVSVLQAGRDITFPAGSSARTEGDAIRVAGNGRLEVTAGRNLDMGTSGGIASVGNLENANLPAGGADIQLAAGVGAKGIDYAGAVTRLVAKLDSGSVDTSTLWLARWLLGDTTLSAADALIAVRALDSDSADLKQQKVRSMVFEALRTTGRDYNDAKSDFKQDYARGYAALELVFPGISTKDDSAKFANYQGDINLFASRVKSEAGGNIDFMAPGGNLIVGLANTPAALVGGTLPGGSKASLQDVLGIVASTTGDIKGFARSDIVVNQSRILTVGGGDILLWSSEGDIDAGKGKKSAVSVPAPIIKIDSAGNVRQEIQGAATGSGIGALSAEGVTAGDVDLIAPKGTVNAGDAGIRAGNINIAALVVKGADNIAASGTSIGTPVADTSVVSAVASGATGKDDDASKSVAAASRAASDAARATQALASSLQPKVVRVDVLGFGAP